MSRRASSDMSARRSARGHGTPSKSTFVPAVPTSSYMTELETSTRVITRVRPTYGDENDCVVKMDGNSTVVQHPLTKTKYKFYYDHCLWSYDRGDRYVSQGALYTLVGKQLLDDSFRGFNVTLLAYGQTGSGKTFTLYGPPEVRRPPEEDWGVMPRLAKDLWKRIKSARREDTEWIVQMTATEIYGTVVKDLLATAKPAQPQSARSASSGGLKIREHAVKGPYVEGLKTVNVRGPKHMMTLLMKANDARHTRPTPLNDFSSRSHFIVQLNLTRIKNVSKARELRGERSCLISVVDLAGSSRDAGDLKVGGATAMERNNINVSLTSLGRIIDKLTSAKKKRRGASSAPGAMSSPSSGQKDYIPYRDNVLTWLLKEALSGNCKTVLVATLSPASTCLDETLSTLRFADRVKKIKTHAHVNEDANPMILIDELRVELHDLRVGAQHYEHDKEKLKEELDEMKGRDVVEQAELEALKAGHLEETDKIKSGYQKQIEELTKTLGGLKDSIGLLQEKVKAKDADFEGKSDELNKVKLELKKRTKTFGEVVEEKEKLIRASQEELQAAKVDAALKLGESSNIVDKLKREIADNELDFQAKLKDAENKLRGAESTREKDMAARDQDLASLRQRIKDLDERLEMSQNAGNEMALKLQGMAQSSSEQETKLFEATEEKKSLQSQIASLENDKSLLSEEGKKLRDRVDETSLLLEKLRKEKEDGTDRFEMELLKSKNDHQAELAKATQEKDDLERVLRQEIDAQLDAHDLARKKMLEDQQRLLDELRKNLEARIVDGNRDHEAAIKGWQKREVDLKTAHEEQLDDLRRQAAEAHALLLKKKQDVADSFREEFEKLQGRHALDLAKLSSDLHDRISELEKQVSSLLMDKEKLRLDFETAKREWEKKEQDLKADKEKAVADAVKAETEKFDVEREKLKREKQAALDEMTQKLEHAEAELDNAKQIFDMQMAAAKDTFEAEKKEIQRKLDEDLRQTKLDHERELEMLNMKHQHEMDVLNKQCADLKDDMARKSEDYEARLKAKDEEIAKLKRRNNRLIEAVRAWILSQRRATADAFMVLSGFADEAEEEDAKQEAESQETDS